VQFTCKLISGNRKTFERTFRLGKQTDRDTNKNLCMEVLRDFGKTKQTLTLLLVIVSVRSNIHDIGDNNEEDARAAGANDEAYDDYDGTDSSATGGNSAKRSDVHNDNNYDANHGSNKAENSSSVDRTSVLHCGGSTRGVRGKTN
jgi:hypothetical protein